MSPATWWLFVCTETVLCLMPGPAVLFVLSSALKAGARKSIASNVGILAANTVYFALSATGVGALLLSSKLFLAVKWIGAAYLIVIGLQLIFEQKRVINASVECLNDQKTLSLFWDGFVLQISNPKAIVFFSALLPQFIDPRVSIVHQVLILGLTSVVIEFSILLGYGIAAGRASELARQPRYARWTNRVAGGLLIGAGAGLATR
jgi:threonine/homoserine/homoserine lactone efflux protein